MERMPKESRLDPDRRSARAVERFSLDKRLALERCYAAAPRQMHADLIYQGYWRVAAQLKTDYEAGRL